MPRHNGEPNMEEIRRQVLKGVSNNFISPLNPYLICIRSNGASMDARAIKLIVYRSNGRTCPQTLSKSRFAWSMNAYAGKTDRASIHTRLPMAIEARNFFNMLHRIEQHKQRITVAMMKSITTPHLKQKLIEACCKAAI